MRAKKPKPVMPPILIDNREQRPLLFYDIPADEDEGGGVLTIPTKVKYLPTGDYSLEGYESEVCVERKSHADLYSTLIRGRERFLQEIERLRSYKACMIMVETDYYTAITQQPFRSRVEPKSIFRTILAFRVRYPWLQWSFVGNGEDSNDELNRYLAAIECYRFLHRYWLENRGTHERLQTECR